MSPVGDFKKILVTYDTSLSQIEPVESCCYGEKHDGDNALYHARGYLLDNQETDDDNEQQGYIIDNIILLHETTWSFRKYK